MDLPVGVVIPDWSFVVLVIYLLCFPGRPDYEDEDEGGSELGLRLFFTLC